MSQSMEQPNRHISRAGVADDRGAQPRGGGADAASWHWVPIRSLAERHRPRILSHLLALCAEDRYLRFGYAASDTQVARYTDLIDFAQDEVFGIFNRRLELIAQAHLAALPGSEDAEFGVSVLPNVRGRGYGGRLFDHAVLHARNRGVNTLIVHAFSENTPMLRIARHAGATIEREGSDASARLRLPPDNLRSHMDEWVEHGAAEFDYQIKRHTRRMSVALETLGELTHQIGSPPPARPSD
jgi:GNAT superfamily N-acetyltransferase